MPAQVLVIADDLTGACDAAIPFKIRGARCLVHLDFPNCAPQPADVNAFSTETRNANGADIEARIRLVRSCVAAENRALIFKKIDSMMRGNPAREIAIAAAVFGCDVAIITPAFPAMGRTVRLGHLHVETDARWTPIHVAKQLEARGLDRCAHFAPSDLREAIQSGCPYLVVESRSERDLLAIASEGLRSSKRILWAGSAGLAAAVAEIQFGTRQPGRTFAELAYAPVLFCIGSDHPSTIAQITALRQQHNCAEFDARTRSTAGISSCLERGEHVLLRVPRDTQPGSLRQLLSSIGPFCSAILMSGGDTASLACTAAGAARIELQDEIITGLPWGILQGGLLNGKPVATKSGAFGGPDALIRVSEYFACPPQ